MVERIFAGCPEAARPSGWIREPRPTAFLDRDGIINVDKGYVSRLEDFEWQRGAKEAIQHLKSAGFRIVIVTNQSGVGRGLYTEADFLKLSEWLLDQIEADAIVYCPHAPEANCPARKPATGMLERVDEVMGVSKPESFLVGDKASDIEAAERFGVQGHFYAGGDLDDFLKSRLLL